jgi:hypothetical protein
MRAPQEDSNLAHVLIGEPATTSPGHALRERDAALAHEIAQRLMTRAPGGE